MTEGTSPPNELPSNEELLRTIRYVGGVLHAILEVDQWAMPVEARDELIALADECDATLGRKARPSFIRAPYCDEATDSGHSSANGLDSR